MKRFIPAAIRILFHAWYDRLYRASFVFTRAKKLHTYAGFPLHIYICDPVSKAWYDHDWERDEIDFLHRGKLKEGARVFDIGAHHGVVALIFSKIVGKKGSVVAVEMDPHHTAIANFNKKNNAASNLQVINAAIGERSGQLFFSGDQIKQNNEKKGLTKIKSLTIDELTQKYGLPSVLYIDVEGFECQALRGAKRTLRCSPDCCIEVHVNCGLESFDGSVEELLTFFPKEKYTTFMAPALHECKFVPFNPKNKLTKNRFYLIALGKNISK